MRNDVYFQNDSCFAKGIGRKVIADDFKYCLERVNNPETKTRGLWVFRDKIKGAKEFSEKKTEHISGVIAQNDSTLMILLNEPFAPFLSLLTMTYGFVYPKEAVEFYKDNFGQHPVGTGSFKFRYWDLDKELILEKNKKYYEKDISGNSLPYLDEVKITFSSSAETEYLDFIGGKYDYLEPSAEILDYLLDEQGNLINPDKKDYTIVKQPWLNTVYIIMIQNKELAAGKFSPFINNKKLRQALNYAIDREKIVKFILKNRGIAAQNGPLPKGMPGYDSLTKGYSYNPEKAKKLLKEAGYPEGKGLELTLVISSDEIQRSVAIALQEQLKEFGINLILEQVLQSTMLTNQQEGEYVFTRGSWGADYFDPENFMALFYSKNLIPNGPNKTGYTNTEVDNLYEKALKLNDFTERKKIYNEMESIIIEDAAWLFLFYNQKLFLLNKNISGFYIDGLNILNLKYTKKNSN